MAKPGQLIVSIVNILTEQDKDWLGTIHILRKHILGFFDPPPLHVIMFSLLEMSKIPLRPLKYYLGRLYRMLFTVI